MKTNLQKVRKAAGFKSAKSFAEHMDMSVNTYTALEQGRHALSLEQAWLFADALGEALGRHVSLDELAGRRWPRSQLTEDERRVLAGMRATDARGRAAIVRTAEGEAGVEGKRADGVGARDVRAG